MLGVGSHTLPGRIVSQSGNFSQSRAEESNKGSPWQSLLGGSSGPPSFRSPFGLDLEGAAGARRQTTASTRPSDNHTPLHPQVPEQPFGRVTGSLLSVAPRRCAPTSPKRGRGNAISALREQPAFRAPSLLSRSAGPETLPRIEEGQVGGVSTKKAVIDTVQRAVHGTPSTAPTQASATVEARTQHTPLAALPSEEKAEAPREVGTQSSGSGSVAPFSFSPAETATSRGGRRGNSAGVPSRGVNERGVVPERGRSRLTQEGRTARRVSPDSRWVSRAKDHSLSVSFPPAEGNDERETVGGSLSLSSCASESPSASAASSRPSPVLSASLRSSWWKRHVIRGQTLAFTGRPGSGRGGGGQGESRQRERDDQSVPRRSGSLTRSKSTGTFTAFSTVAAREETAPESAEAEQDPLIAGMITGRPSVSLLRRQRLHAVSPSRSSDGGRPRSFRQVMCVSDSRAASPSPPLSRTPGGRSSVNPFPASAVSPFASPLREGRHANAECSAPARHVNEASEGRQAQETREGGGRSRSPVLRNLARAREAHRGEVQGGCASVETLNVSEGVAAIVSRLPRGAPATLEERGGMERERPEDGDVLHLRETISVSRSPSTSPAWRDSLLPSMALTHHSPSAQIVQFESPGKGKGKGKEGEEERWDDEDEEEVQSLLLRSTDPLVAKVSSQQGTHPNLAAKEEKQREEVWSSSESSAASPAPPPSPPLAVNLVASRPPESDPLFHSPEKTAGGGQPPAGREGSLRKEEALAEEEEAVQTTTSATAAQTRSTAAEGTAPRSHAQSQSDCGNGQLPLGDHQHTEREGSGVKPVECEASGVSQGEEEGGGVLSAPSSLSRAFRALARSEQMMWTSRSRPLSAQGGSRSSPERREKRKEKERQALPVCRDSRAERPIGVSALRRSSLSLSPSSRASGSLPRRRDIQSDVSRPHSAHLDCRSSPTRPQNVSSSDARPPWRLALKHLPRDAEKKENLKDRTLPSGRSTGGRRSPSSEKSKAKTKRGVEASGTVREDETPEQHAIAVGVQTDLRKSTGVTLSRSSPLVIEKRPAVSRSRSPPPPVQMVDRALSPIAIREPSLPTSPAAPITPVVLPKSGRRDAPAVRRPENTERKSGGLQVDEGRSAAVGASTSLSGTTLADLSAARLALLEQTMTDRSRKAPGSPTASPPVPPPHSPGLHLGLRPSRERHVEKDRASSSSLVHTQTKSERKGGGEKGMKRGTTMREGTHVLSPSQAVSPPPHAPLTDAQRHPPPYSSPSPPLPGAVQTPPGALPPPRGSMVPQAPIRPHAAIHASPQIASESPQYNAGERIFQGQPAMTSQREMKRSPPKGPPGPPREQKGSRRTLQYCTQKLGVIADGGVQPPLRSQGRASPFASASPPKLALSDPSSKVQTFASRATPLPPPAQGIAESKKGFAGSPLTFQGSPRIIYNGGSPVVSEEAVGSPGKFGPSKQQQSDVRSPSPPFQEGPERPVLHEREDVQFLWKSPSSVGPRGSSETSPGPVEKGPRHDFQSQVGRLVHRQPPTSSGAPSPAGALPLVTDMNALTEMSDVFLLSRSGTRERASGGEQSNGQGGVLPSEEVGTHPPVPLQSPVDFFFVRHALEAAEPPHPIVRKSAFRGQSALSFPSKRPASGSERQPECPKRGRLNRDGIDWSLRIDEERAELGGRPRHVTRTLGRAPSVRVLSPPSPAGERRPSGLSGGLGGMSAKPSLRSIPSVVSLASSARGGGGIASFGGVRVDPPRDREGRRRSGSLLPPLRTPSRPMPPAAVGGEGRERGARATGSEREGTRATAEWVSVARSGPGGTVEGVSGRTKRRSAASARTHILPAVSLLMHSNQTP